MILSWAWWLWLELSIITGIAWQHYPGSLSCHSIIRWYQCPVSIILGKINNAKNISVSTSYKLLCMKILLSRCILMYISFWFIQTKSSHKTFVKLYRGLGLNILLTLLYRRFSWKIIYQSICICALYQRFSLLGVEDSLALYSCQYVFPQRHHQTLSWGKHSMMY